MLGSGDLMQPSLSQGGGYDLATPISNDRYRAKLLVRYRKLQIIYRHQFWLSETVNSLHTVSQHFLPSNHWILSAAYFMTTRPMIVHVR